MAAATMTHAGGASEATSAAVASEAATCGSDFPWVMRYAKHGSECS